MILKKQMWEDPDHPTKLKTVPANEKKPDYYARKMCNYFITVTEVEKKSFKCTIFSIPNSGMLPLLCGTN